MNTIPFKKAKNAFIYNLNSAKYYDFRDNSNIIGFSHKRLTTYVKNNISSAWNITLKTIYHERLKKFYQKLFGNEFILASSNSCEEYFSRLFLSSINVNSIEILGENFKSWLHEKKIIYNTEACKNKITIYDINEIFIKCGGDINLFKSKVKDIDNDNILIFNYYWYPALEIETGSADIIILPKIYSGNFNYINILVKKVLIDYLKITNSIYDIPSLYISSSLKNYYLIKDMMEKNKIIRLNCNDFIQSGRLFLPDDLTKVKQLSEQLLEQNIFINAEPPYYNYLPIILEDYQIKYLLKVNL